MSGAAYLLRGDARRIPLADESVDLVVTSPPFWRKRKYAIDGPGEIGNEPTWPEFLDNLWAITDELVRVLKPSGSIWVNLGDTRVTGTGPEWCGIPVKSRLLLPERYRIGCQDRYAAHEWTAGPEDDEETGITPAVAIVRQVQIHEKLNGLPESVDDRTRDSHEDWVHIVRRPDYFSAVDEIREVSVTGDRAMFQSHRGNGRGLPPRGPSDLDAVTRVNNPLGKLPGSVWRLASEPLRIPPETAKALNLPDHYAAFCSEVVRRIVLAWSPPGICCECGQGRAPVVDKQPGEQSGGPVGNKYEDIRTGGPMAGMTKYRENATILGYACACTPYTDHPGTGHVYDGQETRYADQLAEGRYANTGHGWGGNQDLGARPKVGPWREYHLTGWTPPPTRPAVVLDVFGGTGTTAGVARQLGRIGISMDLSADYNRLARWRIFESGAFGKAEARTWAERQGILL